MLTYAVLLLSGAIVVGQADNSQTTTRGDFEEYCRAMQGRWFNDNEMLVEKLWPGFGEQGKKVVSYSDVKIVADGNAIEGVWYAGKGTSKWIEVWDAASNHIKKLGVMSDGTTWQEVRCKKGDRWECSVTLTRPNGKVESFTSTLTWSDNGDTHAYTSEVGGAPGVYRRVGKIDR